MKNDKFLIIIALIILTVAITVNGPFKYVLIGLSMAISLIVILKAINPRKPS